MRERLLWVGLAGEEGGGGGRTGVGGFGGVDVEGEGAVVGRGIDLGELEPHDISCVASWLLGCPGREKRGTYALSHAS